MKESEFSIHDKQAQELSPWDFAAVHKAEVRLWGNPLSYLAVLVDGTDYLWRIKELEYDGWDRNVQAEGLLIDKDGNIKRQQ